MFVCLFVVFTHDALWCSRLPAFGARVKHFLLNRTRVHFFAHSHFPKRLDSFVCLISTRQTNWSWIKQNSSSCSFSFSWFKCCKQNMSMLKVLFLAAGSSFDTNYWAFTKGMLCYCTLGSKMFIEIFVYLYFSLMYFSYWFEKGLNEKSAKCGNF